MLERIIAQLRENSSSLKELEVKGELFDDLTFSEIEFNRRTFANQYTTEKDHPIHNSTDDSLGKTNFKDLTEALGNNTVLETLKLSKFGIMNLLGSRGEKLSKALEKNSSIIRLGIQDFSVGYKAMESLLEGLKASSSLKELSFKNTTFFLPRDVASLVSSNKLTKLSFVDCNIAYKRDGYEAISKVLDGNVSLKELSITGGNVVVSDQGVINLAVAIKNNSALERLTIDLPSGIDAKSLELLAQAVTESDKFRKLSIGTTNSFDNARLDILVKYFGKNPFREKLGLSEELKTLFESRIAEIEDSKQERPASPLQAASASAPLAKVNEIE